MKQVANTVYIGAMKGGYMSNAETQRAVKEERRRAEERKEEEDKKKWNRGISHAVKKQREQEENERKDEEAKHRVVNETEVTKAEIENLEFQL